MSFEDELSEHDDTWGNVEPPERKDVPNGTYQVRVDRVEIKRALTTGNLYLNWGLRVRVGEYEGSFLWKRSGFRTGKNLSHLKADLAVCGVDLEKLSDLPRNLDRLLDVELEVKQVTNGDYTNVYVNRRIVNEDSAPYTPSPAETPENRFDDDDIPF